MKIGILSRNKNLYSTNSLMEAFQKRDHDVKVIDYLKCHMDITSHRPMIYLGDEALKGYDAIIPRIGASHTFFGCAVVRQFEVMGVYSLNESVAISRARDKLRSLQLLARKGIGLPVTGFAHDPRATKHLIRLCGGSPLVIKLLEGTQGVGVVLAETQKAAESVIEAFRGLNANILAQEYIEEAGGSDIRCFVVGNRVVASIKRQAKDGEFRSNLHRGGTATIVKITPEERSTAVRAAKIMGLSVAGVDLLRSNH
ncbi:MAG: 30S ribosomal protein S6--L-glutamate ligase, partial [Verrucomicrobia bacterium]|nr:30S ribosomal protein S6--L-glutamate ligase [Verrucomicrobiota bacterium]